MRRRLLSAALLGLSAACAPAPEPPRAPAPASTPRVALRSDAEQKGIAEVRLEIFRIAKSDDEIVALAAAACALAAAKDGAETMPIEQVAVALSIPYKLVTALEDGFCPAALQTGYRAYASLRSAADAAATEPPPWTPPAHLTAKTRIRGVDLHNTLYPAGICKGESWPSPYPILVVDGVGESGDRDDETYAGVQIDGEPRYVDLDGDGIEDVLLEVGCNGGGMHVEGFVLPLTLRGDRLELLGGRALHPTAYRDLPLADARFAFVELVGHDVVMHERVPADADEPRCCYSARARVRWSWNGKTFVRGHAVREPAPSTD